MELDVGRERQGTITADQPDATVHGGATMDEVQMGEGQDQDRPVIADLLTGQPREATELEDLVQRTVVVLAGEYGFPLEAMARDVPIAIEVDGRHQRKRADLVVFTPG